MPCSSSLPDIADFLEINASNNPLVPFTSDPSTHRQCFNVTIVDDRVLEDTEKFNLTLSLSEGSANFPVLVMPDSSEVEIQDGDCKSKTVEPLHSYILPCVFNRS